MGVSRDPRLGLVSCWDVAANEAPSGKLGPSQAKAKTTMNDDPSIITLRQDPGWALGR